MSTSPEELEAPQPPRGHVRVVYLGPVAQLSPVVVPTTVFVSTSTTVVQP